MSTGSLLFDAFLCLLLVGIALGVVLARDLFAAVVFFIVFGLFVAIAWVRLDAIDVALAEATIGAGLTGVLLLRAAARLRASESAPLVRPRPGRRLLAAACALLLFAALATVLVAAPPAAGLAEPVRTRMDATGLGNPVTAVLLNFRGYDTLLESVVLLAALLAVWSLSADTAWGARPGLREHARPDGVMSSFARVLPPLGLLVGVHLFWAGADAPGGAFQAGTVLAAAWLLAVMADVVRAPAVGAMRLRLLLIAGPGVFLLVAVLAIPLGGFLVFPPDWAKPLVLLIEAALAASVAATLGLLVLGPVRQR